MTRIRIFIVFLVINTLVLFLALNPWVTDWQDQGNLILVFDALFLIIIGIPILLYQPGSVSRDGKHLY